MKRLFKLIAIASLLNFAIPAFALERPQIQFDKRSWIVSYQGTTAEQVLIEFVPEGQGVESWSELLSTQFLIGMQQQMPIAEYVEKAKKTISAKCPAVRWKTLKQTEEGAMYEWGVDACKGIDDQSELTRVIRGAEGLHVLRYVIKRSPFPTDKRAEWTRLLSEIKLLRD